MDELVGRLVANVGVDRGAAEKAVGIILDFLRKEGPPDKVQALIDRLPGAEAYSHNIRNLVVRFPWAASWGPERK
jgi:hypothetical protein